MHLKCSSMIVSLRYSNLMVALGQVNLAKDHQTPKKIKDTINTWNRIGIFNSICVKYSIINVYT